MKKITNTIIFFIYFQHKLQINTNNKNCLFILVVNLCLKFISTIIKNKNKNLLYLLFSKFAKRVLFRVLCKKYKNGGTNTNERAKHF